ncbi:MULTISPECIES: hypothetical protein [unclassified Halomonas]|uniref:hypothetical protein n=1 Tax=unclassified Halomonas TaxID=2609666 RepID=UPI000990901B|nr:MULTISPECIES: hypothetical protein [unclassified Halomonas]AQU81421.1 hypothetical protein B2G49_01635 [Halomonas sp. 'Soap Lake \
MSLQNEPLKQADGYAETAYRADAIPEQSYAPQNEMLRGRILETRLPWGSYLGINPTTHQYSESWFREYDYMGRDYHDHTMINEKRWSKRVDENIGILYRLIRFIFVIYSHGFSFIRTGGGVGGGWLFTGVAFGTAILGSLATIVYGNNEFPWVLVKLLFWVALFCSIATLFLHLWEKHELKFYKGNRNWSDDYAFCRRTGMVMTSRGDFPFYEFDAYIEMRVGTQGSQFHSFKVIHRYPHRSPDPLTNNSLEFSFAVDGSITQRYAVWDMLQRYMDVSQPLPDVPELEPFRHLDPTTKAYDEAGKRGRPATYWRDLYANSSEEELKALREAHRAEVDSTIWGGRPDLMELSVPNYRETRKGEPEDVNDFGRFPWKEGKFVDRPEATPSLGSTDQQLNDEHTR